MIAKIPSENLIYDLREIKQTVYSKTHNKNLHKR
jgi:hypothetical protein